MGERFYPNPNQYPEGENTGMSLDAYKAKKAADKAAAEQQRRAPQGPPQSGYPRYEARPPQQPPQQAPQYGAPASPTAPRNPQYQGPQQQAPRNPQYPGPQQQAPRGPEAPQAQYPRQPQFQQPPQGQYPRQPEYQQSPRPSTEMIHQPQPEGEERKRFTFQWTRKRAIGAVAATALLVGGPSLVASNAFGWRDMIAGEGGSNATQNLNMEKIQLETLGTESLKPGQCDTPEAGLVTAYVTGRLPLPPIVASTAEPTPGRSEPYMNEEFMEDMKSSEAEHFEKFITESQFPEATTEELPLILNICELDGSSAITEEDGQLIVDRSLLKVEFKDPDGQWKRNIIRAVPQEEGASDEYVETDPNKGQFVTLPWKENKMFLKNDTGDAVYDKAVTDMNAAMETPLQKQTILAKMEAEAIQQLDNVVDGHENITYPEGAESLQQTIDRALVKRLIGDKDVKLTFKGNYATKMNVPNDPTSKLPITDAPLNLIDSSEKFIIENITIEYGALSEPEIIEEPTPEPTETPAPADAP